MESEENNGLGKVKSRSKNKSTDSEKEKQRTALVPHIDVQVKFIRRFRNMIGKKIPVSRLLSYIKSLQRAIYDKVIRGGDIHAGVIDLIQDACIQHYKRATGQNVEIKVSKELSDRISSISKSEKVRPSVAFLKRFVGLIGKPYHEIREKLKRIVNNLPYMIERGMIRENDPFFEKVKVAQRAMENALKNRDRINIPEATLNGLNGIIAEEKSASGHL